MLLIQSSIIGTTSNNLKSNWAFTFKSVFLCTFRQFKLLPRLLLRLFFTLSNYYYLLKNKPILRIVKVIEDPTTWCIHIFQDILQAAHDVLKEIRYTVSQNTFQINFCLTATNASATPTYHHEISEAFVFGVHLNRL